MELVNNNQTVKMALDKMNEEMAKEHSPEEDRVHNWLCEHIEGDMELAESILVKSHTIKGSLEYCCQKAQKQAEAGARYAMVADDTVFSWVKEYFLKSEEKKPEPAKAKKPAKKTRKKKDKKTEEISLFDEAKSSNDTAKEDKKDEKKEATDKKDAKSDEKSGQISLFDFLE